MRRAAPLVAKLKDREKRPEYVRKLAGDLGMELEPVQRAVAAAAARGGGPAVPAQAARPAGSRVDGPQAVVEREALKLALQVPVLAGPMFDALGEENYRHPLHVAVRCAVAEAGGAAAATGGAVWIERVRDACADLAGKALVGELAVEPLLTDGEVDPRYVSVQLAQLQLGAVTGRIRELKSKVQRVNPVSNKDEYLGLVGELFSLEQHARGLREQAVGGL
jgi:DNA primase